MLRLRRAATLVAGALLTASGCDSQDASPLSASSLLGPAAATDRIRPGACIDPAGEQILIRRMIDAVNTERAKHKAGPVHGEETLMQIADFYACRLVEGGFFAHEDPFGGSTVGSRAADFGYAFDKLGENLAAGQESVDEALAAWLASPTHRAILLDPEFTEIGVAIKAGGPSGVYWVQEFGRPLVEGDHEPVATSSGATASQPGK
ncbi:MAG TPA: CAP domain-containing protein [Phycisphaerae bacterium]|nr:CAP domain-containing protein [Phycisphaerae bacterium]